jgi:hypothetical protein
MSSISINPRIDKCCVTVGGKGGEKKVGNRNEGIGTRAKIWERKTNFGNTREEMGNLGHVTPCDVTMVSIVAILRKIDGMKIQSDILVFCYSAGGHPQRTD